MTELKRKETEIQKHLRDLAEKHPDRVEKLLQGLLQSDIHVEYLNTKTNAEIGTLLLEHVWADLDLWTLKSEIVKTAIERLRRS